MNYIREINAFYDWLELNELLQSSVLLWHTLMHLNNKCGWQESFTVARSVIEAKSGLKKDSYYTARNQLYQKGLIEYKERGNKATMFKIIPLSEKQTANQTTYQTTYQTTTPTANQTTDQTITKLNETETKQKNNTSASDSERKTLSVLADVKGYPFEYETDLSFIRQISVDFPDVDIQEQIKAWATYKLDKPLQPKSNPRSQLRNWVNNAKKWDKNQKNELKNKKVVNHGYWEEW